MATANPFASLLSGLGIKMPGGGTAGSTPSGVTPAKSAYMSSLGGYSDPVKKQSIPYSQPAPALNYTPAPAISKAPVSPLASKSTGTNALDQYKASVAASKPSNAPYTAVSASGAPYSTSAALQGKNAAPAANMTSAATGLPAYGGAPRTANMSVYNPNASSAKDSYARSLTSTNAPASSVPTFSPDSFGEPSATDPGSSSSSSSSYSGGGTTSYSPPVGAGTSDYRKQYTDLLSGLYSTKDLSEANESLDELNKRMAKTKVNQREEERYIRENKAGALARGIEGQISENSRKSSAELADLAIARAPYEDYVKRGEAAYKELYGLGGENDPFTLSEGQVRYEYDPASGGYKQVGSVASSPGAASDTNALLSPTEAQALGVPYGTTRAQAFGSTPTKPLTEAQAKDLTYGQRGQQATQIIDALANTIVGYNSAAYAGYGALEPNAIGNTLVPDAVRQYKQAERNFLTAILRRESGASISPSEFSVAERQYFPRPGDDPKTLAQKKQLRDTAIASFLQNAGQSGVQGGGYSGGGSGGLYDF